MKKNSRRLLIDDTDGMVFGEMDLALTRRREICTLLRFTPIGKSQSRPTHLVVEEQSGILLGDTTLRYLRGKEFVVRVRLKKKWR